MGFLVGGIMEHFVDFSPLSSGQVSALFYFFLGLGELSASTTTLFCVTRKLLI